MGQADVTGQPPQSLSVMGPFKDPTAAATVEQSSSDDGSDSGSNTEAVTTVAAPMVSLVHWGCRLAQGILAGVTLATILLIANAGGASDVTSARVLAALGSSPSLLPALRFGTYILSVLSLLGAAWGYLEFRVALREAEAELTRGDHGVTAADAEAGSITQGAQIEQLQPAGSGAPASCPTSASSYITAALGLDRNAATEARGLPKPATLAAGVRSLISLLCYCLVVASVFGCMPSDVKVHEAAKAVAATSGSIWAAAEALVEDPQLRRHIEAWITLSAGRLVFSLCGWIMAGSTAASPSGIDLLMRRISNYRPVPAVAEQKPVAEVAGPEVVVPQ